MKPSSEPISDIQVLRGLAATGVLLAHAAGMLLYGDVPVRLPNLEWGAFGVDVFFVISGFVMAFAEGDKFGRRGAALPFFLRRLARIVPLFWLATLCFALLTAPWGAPARVMRPFFWGAAQSAVFVPTADGSTSILPTGWTLYYEMAFYGCFALALALPLRRRAALVLLAGFIAAMAVAGAADLLPARVSCVANLQALEFLFGLGIAELRRAGVRLPGRAGPILSALAGLYAVLEAPHLDGYTMWRGLEWGVPAALIVGGLALAPPPRASRLRAALERLGDASYSVYLVHFPLFWAIGLLIPGVPRSGPHMAQVYVFGLVAVGLPASLLVYRFVERPVTRRLQGMLRRAEAARALRRGPDAPEAAPAR